MSEHDCIKHLIADRWWGEVEQLVHPIQNEARQHLLGGRRSVAIALETQVSQLTQRLMKVRAAAQHRLRRLELDAALRSEGKKYPDFYEVQCSSSWSKFDGSQDF